MSPSNLTVLMPVHGESPFLSRAVETVLAQSFEEFQFVIILDRPTPETKSLLIKFASEDPRINLIESAGTGISNALNSGLAATDADFIARIDADDEMHPDRLLKQLPVIKQEDTVCVGSQVKVINETGEYLYTTNYPTRSFAIKRALHIRNVIAHPSVMYRKDAVINAGGYRSQFNGAEDYDLWLRISKQGRIRNMTECFTNYRVNDFQITSRNRDIQVGLDAGVRRANFNNVLSFLSQKSALRINRGIEAGGARRYAHLIVALLLQPVTFFEFIIYIIWPRRASL